jgi:integrase/recombinase XerD
LTVVEMESKSPPIPDALDSYLSHLKNAGRSPLYVDSIWQYLGDRDTKSTPWKPFTLFASEQGIGTLSQVNEGLVSDWLAQLRQAGVTQYTYAKFVEYLKRWYNWMIEDGLVAQMPIKLARPRIPESTLNVFTNEEVSLLSTVLKKENLRDQAIFALLVDTGIRAGELCSLTTGDLHVSGNFPLEIRGERTKTKRGRTVFLSDYAKPILKRYMALRATVAAPVPNLFLGFYASPVYKGGNGHHARRTTGKYQFGSDPLTRNGLYTMVRKWGDLAGITVARCSPHTFRHYYAVNYLREGGDVLSLQQLLGHSKLEMTQRYAKLAEVDLIGRQNQFSPALRLIAPRYRKAETL